MTEPGSQGPAVPPDAPDEVEAPSRTRFAEPSSTPDPSPAVPPEEPTDLPTDEPTDLPTAEPTDLPADEPTDLPPEEPVTTPLAESPPIAPPPFEAPPVATPLEAPALSEPHRSPVVEAATAEEPVSDAVPAEEPPRQSGPLVPALAGVVTALALLAGFLTYTVIDTRGAAPVESSRREALDAGRSAARLLFSYDYRHLAKDFAAGRATTTGKFQAEYDKTTSKLVQDVAPRYKAVVSADVSEAAVVRAEDNRVVLLVFVNQSSASTLAANPKITQSRLEMTLVRVGGHWLVRDIKAL